MAYEIREKNDKYYVVDTETQKIRGTYDSEDAAEDRKDDLDFRAHMRARIDRIPVKEMTVEEKAAEYDKMQSGKDDKTDDKLPPKKEEDKTPEKKKKSLYWGDLLDEET